MKSTRRSGILLHPTSLPGPYGIGEIGSEARRFVSALSAMGQSLWQILPMGPTSYGDSPYQSLSTFAGNTLLISIDQLVKDGLLHEDRARKLAGLPEQRVDYGRIIPERKAVLQTVCRTFKRRASAQRWKAFQKFCEEQAYWMDDYALFVALKDAHGGRPWTEWGQSLVEREPSALKEATRRHKTAIRHEKILQYLFEDQWKRLLRHAHSKKVQVVGDIPIFVAHDSADVWANQDLFFLDNRGQPIVVAGVPPDYFSSTGQLWGNPLYRWSVHQHSGYAWWVARMRRLFDLVDWVRIDHFRGFEAYWEIHATEQTAINGRWVEGPGADLFHALNRELGTLPIIAEDLGVITPPVEALRDQFKFPGMRVLQFAFGGEAKPGDDRPANYPKNCVVYTGTHDNDTTAGWFYSEAGQDSTRTQEEIEAERKRVLKHLGTDGTEVHWDLIRVALESSADTAIVPMQDLLGLDSSARMNVPGRNRGNWQWRMPDGVPDSATRKRLLQLTCDSRRVPRA